MLGFWFLLAKFVSDSLLKRLFLLKVVPAELLFDIMIVNLLEIVMPPFTEYLEHRDE